MQDLYHQQYDGLDKGKALKVRATVLRFWALEAPTPSLNLGLLDKKPRTLNLGGFRPRAFGFKSLGFRDLGELLDQCWM